MPTTRVVLVDDHAVIRDSIRSLIDTTLDLRVISEVRDLTKVRAEVVALAPDLVVLDVSSDDSALRLARELQAVCPLAALLLITEDDRPSRVREICSTGALGYVRRLRVAADVLAAIRAVASGDHYLGMALNPLRSESAGRRGNSAVSNREVDVLRFSALGYRQKEIAAILGISQKTVEAHKTNALRKLNLRSRVDLIRHAVLHNWLKAS